MRTLGDEVIAAIAGQDIWPVLLLSIQIGDTTYLISDHYKNIAVGTDIYLPNGNLLNIGRIDNNTIANNNNIDISLSAIDSLFRQDVLAADSIGGRVIIQRGLISTTSGDVLDDPFTVFDGVIFQVGITEEAPITLPTQPLEQVSFTISVDVRSSFYLLEELSGRFTENSSQQSFFPSDLSMEYVASFNGKTVRFGGDQ